MRVDWPAVVDGVRPHQAEQLGKACAGPVGILGGGPGTGKTFSAAALAREIIATHGQASLGVCAPTGKAAVRIEAAMLKNNVPVQATTVHRALGVQRNGHDGKGWSFAYGELNPLPQRFWFLEEASMLDTDLAASFFAAMAPGTHVLLIGDIGQLPPVGHGAPLRDLIAAGLPYGELTEVHRNAGDIVHVCKAIRAGRRFVPSPGVDLEAGWNLAHVPASNATEAAWRLEKLLANPPHGLDPVWDVQVLVTVNEKSELSRAALNKRLQGVLNPPQPGARPSDKFRDGDKVICTSNGLRLRCSPLADIDSIPKAEADEFVANGEIGRASQVRGSKKMMVSFTAPERTVVVAGEGMGDFDLAYAVTVHKSQGSQWPVVVYMIDDYPGARFIGCRELTYTAISRAEKLAICIGRQSVLDVDCARVALSGRKTFLKELLDEAA